MKMYYVIYDEYEPLGDYWHIDNVKGFETRWEATQFMKKIINTSYYRNVFLTRTITEPKL